MLQFEKNRLLMSSAHEISLLLSALVTSVPYHIETSQLICRADQLTGFYMMGNIGH